MCGHSDFEAHRGGFESTLVPAEEKYHRRNGLLHCFRISRGAAMLNVQTRFRIPSLSPNPTTIGRDTNRTLPRRQRDLEALRLKAVEAILAGRRPTDVAIDCGISQRCIYKWMASYRLAGAESLLSVRNCGRPPKFTCDLLDRVLDAMEAHDLETGSRTFWTTKAFQDLAENAFGSVLSRSAAQRMLASAGIRASLALSLAPKQGDAQELLRFVMEGGRSAENEIWFGPVAIPQQSSADGSRETNPRLFLISVRAPRAIYFQILRHEAASEDFAGFVEGLVQRSQRQLILIPGVTKDCGNSPQPRWLADLSSRQQQRLVVLHEKQHQHQRPPEKEEARGLFFAAASNL
jgi:transposase